jgi:hypothetical protein
MLVMIALLRVAAVLTLVVFGCFFVRLMLTRQAELGYYALGLLGLFGVLRVTAFVKARHLSCPLCHGTVIQNKSCRKHRNSHCIPLLGHLWTVVVDVLFRAGFRCMYCGTAFRLRK